MWSAFPETPIRHAPVPPGQTPFTVRAKLCPMRMASADLSPGIGRCSWGKTYLLLALLLLGTGCRSSHTGADPAIMFTQVPHAGAGGPDRTEYIGGKVTGATPGERIVIYTHTSIWWVQPTSNAPFTEIQPDSTWKNSTHLGADYAALLVGANYRPDPRIESLPSVGNGVIAVSSVTGRPGQLVDTKTIHFSGYDWIVRAASSDRGGEPNAFDPENAWTDDHGFLHLRMALRNGHWTCAEVSLGKSLGFGTYRFVVQDTSSLPSSAVVGLFTWDDIRSVDFRNEIDIELSRWGNPETVNAQYVVQPFYVPENVSRFQAPPGTLIYAFRWEPGTVDFKTFRGPTEGSNQKPISEHVFTSGVPSPASETIHMNLYDFQHSKRTTSQAAEVVVEKFEFAP